MGANFSQIHFEVWLANKPVRVEVSFVGFISKDRYHLFATRINGTGVIFNRFDEMY